MRGAQSRRRAERGRAWKGHDRGGGQDGSFEPLSCFAFRHTRPTCRRGGAASPGTSRARTRPVPARSADRGGRWPAHRLGGGGLEARCRLGRAIGLQHCWRRGGRCGGPLGSRTRVLLRWRPSPPRLSLARGFLCGHDADEPDLRRDAQIRHGRPVGSLPPRHARAHERRTASRGPPIRPRGHPLLSWGLGAGAPATLSAASKSAKARTAKAAPGGAHDWRKRAFDQQ